MVPGGRRERRVFLRGETAGAQTQGPSWGIGYRVHKAEGRLRIPLIPFLCLRGFGSVGAGNVEVAEWETKLSTRRKLVEPRRSTPGQASGFLSGRWR